MITQIIKKQITQIANKIIPNGFSDYQRLRQKTPFGQIATIFTILIMVVFFLTIITINIGRIAEHKTRLSNAADAAALAMASSLGSMSQLYSYNEPSGIHCEDDWFLTLIPFRLAFDIATGKWGDLVQSLGDLGEHIMDIIDRSKGLKRRMSNLDPKEQIGESAMLVALSGVVTDPNYIDDVHDYDEDTLTDKEGDKIPYFTGWYARRLDALIALSVDKTDGLRELIDRLGNFVDYVGGRRNCVPVDADSDGTYDYLSCAYDPALPWSRQGFSDWFLIDEFIPLLRDLESYVDPDGVLNPIDFGWWQIGPDNDEVDRLINEINQFYVWAHVFLGYRIDPNTNEIIFEGLDARLSNPGDWLGALYKVKLENPNNPNDPEEKCFGAIFSHEDFDPEHCIADCVNRRECDALPTEEERADCREACEQECGPDWYTRLGNWALMVGTTNPRSGWLGDLDMIRQMFQDRIDEIINTEIRPGCETTCIENCKKACAGGRADMDCTAYCNSIDFTGECEHECTVAPNGDCVCQCDCKRFLSQSWVCRAACIPACVGSCNVANFNMRYARLAVCAACRTCINNFFAAWGGEAVVCASIDRTVCQPCLYDPVTGCVPACVADKKATCLTDCQDCQDDCTPANLRPCIDTCINNAIAHNPRIQAMRALINRIDDAIEHLEEFVDRIDNPNTGIRPAIRNYVLDYYNTTNFERNALYSWADKDAQGNLIWHHVRVTRSDFILPQQHDFWKITIPIKYCTGADNRWGYVCVRVEKYDSESSHSLWRFRFHKGPSINDVLNVTDKDGDHLLTIDDIVTFDAGGNLFPQDPAYFTVYGLGGWLEQYGMKTTSYACFGYRIYETAPAPRGWGGIRLVPGSQLDTCKK